LEVEKGKEMVLTCLCLISCHKPEVKAMNEGVEPNNTDWDTLRKELEEGWKPDPSEGRDWVPIGELNLPLTCVLVDLVKGYLPPNTPYGRTTLFIYETADGQRVHHLCGGKRYLRLIEMLPPHAIIVVGKDPSTNPATWIFTLALGEEAKEFHAARRKI
jgi:hypothetical protein